MLAARTAAQLESVAAEITNAGGKAEILAVDLVGEDRCSRVVRAAREEFGGVDILVNNAGIYGPVKPIEEITAEEWDAVDEHKFARRVFDDALRAARYLRAARRRGGEYLQHFGESGIRMGRGIRFRESGHARAHAHYRRGRREARRARKRDLPGPGAGDRNVAGIGTRPRRTRRPRRR